MPKISFTVRKIESLSPPGTGRVDYWDDSLPGFGLRISSQGRRTWMLMYRTTEGRQRRFKLGISPAMPLADARKLAGQKLNAVALGKDPAEEKKSARNADSIAALAEIYIEKYAKPNKKSWMEDRRMLDRDIIPAWGNRKVGSIRRREVIELMEKIVDRGAPILANRTFEVVRRMFRFAIERDITEIDPCIGLSKPSEERQRDRVLTEEEIRKVWTAIELEQLIPAAIMKMRLLTVQRGAEIRMMRWGDIDQSILKVEHSAWWTIPADNAKNGHAHRVPLTPPAVSLLKRIRASHSNEEFVFPGQQNRRGVKAWSVGDRIRTNSKVNFVPHDLRRTAASLMTGMGISRLTVSKLLNHAESGVTSVYDRHSYDQEKKFALEAWARRLADIIDGKQNDTPHIVQIVRS